MTNPFTLTHAIWKKISNAGESGSMWIAALGEGFVFIDHTDEEGGDDIPQGSTVNLLKDKSFTLKKLDPILNVSADNVNDVYYALYIDSRTDTVETAKIITDMV